MSALLIFGLAAIFGPWLIALAPVVAGLFLLAPPIGVYQHDETPVPRVTLRLVVSDTTSASDRRANERRYLLTLLNDGPALAVDFRVRIVIPHLLVPPHAASRLLGALHAGSLGRNWAIESAVGATSVTFRAGRPADAGVILLHPGDSLDLADLILPIQVLAEAVELEYQVSGGSSRPILARVGLPARDQRHETRT
jgi:hypothetical protein